MKLNVWYEEDIRNNLAAAAAAADLIRTPQSEEEQAYLRGYLAALNIISTSFGIELTHRNRTGRQNSTLATAPQDVKYIFSRSEP